MSWWMKSISDLLRAKFLNSFWKLNSSPLVLKIFFKMSPVESPTVIPRPGTTPRLRKSGVRALFGLGLTGERFALGFKVWLVPVLEIGSPFHFYFGNSVYPFRNLVLVLEVQFIHFVESPLIFILRENIRKTQFWLQSVSMENALAHEPKDGFGDYVIGFKKDLIQRFGS